MSLYSYFYLQPYFCGHEDDCRRLGSLSALSSAKSNVETHFPVVGVLEEMEDTFAVLEKKLPKFFKGVKQVYEDLDGESMI